MKISPWLWLAPFYACTFGPDKPDPVYIDRTEYHLREYAKNQKPKVQGCMDLYQKENPKAQGELHIVNIIESDGRISDKFVKENSVDTEASALETCILKAMDDWHYPRIGKPWRLMLKYKMQEDK